MPRPQGKIRIGGGRRARLRARAQRSGAAADRPPRGFPVRRRIGRHRLRRRRGDRRRRPRLFARRRHGRRLHDGTRPRAGAPGQARAGRHRRRRAVDEHRRARRHRGDEPGQPLDPVRRQRPLRRDRLAERPYQPGRRPREDGGRRRHQAHPHGRRPRPTSPTARACCARATAPASSWCACGRPSRPSSSATSTPRSAATASAPRWRAKRAASAASYECARCRHRSGRRSGSNKRCSRRAPSPSSASRTTPARPPAGR